jgi:hypothetical protein
MCWIIGKGHEKHSCGNCEHQMASGDTSPCSFCMTISTGHCKWKAKKEMTNLPRH